MRIRDVMTRDVVTVLPHTSAKHAGELMARGALRRCRSWTSADGCSGSSRRPTSCATAFRRIRDCTRAGTSTIRPTPFRYWCGGS